MATYAISDVHGCYAQFMRLLDKVSPAGDDELYVLGDVIDRGPGSVEMLKWCVDAPANVHVLLGNHEDMAGGVVRRDPAGMALRFSDAWCFDCNGGLETRAALERGTDATWRTEVLAPWLEGLRPWAAVEAGGRPVMLVHAGFDPSGWGPRSRYWPELAGDRFSHSAREDVGLGFGVQGEQDMVWARRGWYDCPVPAPTEVVFGHTPTLGVDHILSRAPKEVLEASAGSEPGRVWHCMNRHDIDCGCCAGGRLAALRLDDMEEYYVPGLEVDWTDFL